MPRNDPDYVDSLSIGEHRTYVIKINQNMENLTKPECGGKAVSTPQEPSFYRKLETTELLTLLKRKGL